MFTNLEVFDLMQKWPFRFLQLISNHWDILGRKGRFPDEIGKGVYKVTVVSSYIFSYVVCGKLLTLLKQKGGRKRLKIEIAAPFHFVLCLFYPHPIYRSQISERWE